MSTYSKFKILYIIRSYDERSGQKIAKSLAGKYICSDLTFRDAHAISAIDDIHEWTRSEFPNPTLLPNFKLQPIVKLFSDQFMNSDR